MKKKAVVVHSGGMDSSICLALAIQEHGRNHLLSLSFDYGQRQKLEVERAASICQDWQVEHKVVHFDCLKYLTQNSLTNNEIDIHCPPNSTPNTFVVGRNGLFARLAAIQAQSIGANLLYMGVMELECANSGYPDCSRHYMNLLEQTLRIDLKDESFRILTPLVSMNKKETLQIAYDLGILSYLLRQTISCYHGIPELGCKVCPACKLRNAGLKEFEASCPSFIPPFELQFST